MKSHAELDDVASGVGPIHTEESGQLLEREIVVFGHRERMIEEGLTVGVSGEHSEAVRVHCTPG